MKMHKVGSALSLSAMLLAGHSATARAEINLMPQDVSGAPHFSQTSLQSLTSAADGYFTRSGDSA